MKTFVIDFNDAFSSNIGEKIELLYVKLCEINSLDRINYVLGSSSVIAIFEAFRSGFTKSNIVSSLGNFTYSGLITFSHGKLYFHCYTGNCTPQNELFIFCETSSALLKLSNY